MRIDRHLREQWVLDGPSGTFDLPQGWMQGRSVFGGMTASACAALAHRVVPQDDRALRLAHVELMSPVAPGALHGEASVLREGRNTTFVGVQLQQGDRAPGRASFVFARQLETSLRVEAPPVPEVPDPEALTALPYVPGIMPEFTQHVDMRWVQGRMPYSGGDQARFVACVRYREPVGDAEGLLALLDTFPSPSLSVMSKPAPASTVTWTAHLLSAPDPTDGWFTVVSDTVVGVAGMHTCTTTLYDAAGLCLGWSEQLVAVFAD